jgi:hypothetical protein
MRELFSSFMFLARKVYMKARNINIKIKNYLNQNIVIIQLKKGFKEFYVPKLYV